MKLTENMDDNKSERDDRSFLSINDFLNADDFANSPNPLFEQWFINITKWFRNERVVG